MPGHVAQMQKLFQAAKTTFRLDVRFAASPVGSIDSRLPASGDPNSNQDTSASAPSMEPRSESSNTPSKDWRYSTAPRFVAQFEWDVREPFPEGSPQLPALNAIDGEQGKMLVAEPLSSGFTTPVNHATFSPTQTEKNSSPPCADTEHSEHVMDDSVDIILREVVDEEQILSADDLQKSLKTLSMNNDYDVKNNPENSSPIVVHLKKQSGNIGEPYPKPDPKLHDTISLSESAKAAAASAKVKRRILTELFPKPPTHKTSPASASAVSSTSHPPNNEPRPCPDPLLHQRGPAVICPDPTLHFKPSRPDFHDDESPRHPHPFHPSFIRGHGGAYHRATDTGSPMPLLKTRASAESSREMRRQSHETMRFPHHQHDSRMYRRHHDPLDRPRPTTADEHFQPGWYYSNEPSPAHTGYGQALYSFSTAAAKVIGQDPAPDSRIRDSYRTDTLTPLAKPPNRFRKNGILALANSRGVGKYYGGPVYQSRSQTRHPHFPADVRFRSSPPRSFSGSRHDGPSRKRARDAETRQAEIFEDDAIVEEDEIEIDPRLKLEEGEEVIEVDEETRAAVRMSLYGSPSSAQSSMKELSPNVTAWRRGDRPPGSRKKRRPSYWDGDLADIVRSPGARHVVNSPVIKDVDLRSQQAEVEYEEVTFEDEEDPSDDDLEGISKIAEGPTMLLDDEDVQMES